MSAWTDFIDKVQQLDPSSDISKLRNAPSFMQSTIMQEFQKQSPNSLGLDPNSPVTKNIVSNLMKAPIAPTSAVATIPKASAASPIGMSPGDSSYYDNILKQLGHVNAGVAPADLQQAGLLAGANYDPQISELRREQGQAKTDTQRQMQDLLDALNMGTRSTSTMGKNYDKDLQEIYQVLGKQLTGLKGQQQQQYAQTGKDVAAGYGEAATTQDAAAKQLQAALQGNADKLGQQSAVGTPLAQLAAQLGVSQSRTAASKAAAVSNVQQRGAEASSAATMGISSAARESAQKRADLRTDIANTLGQLQNTYLTGKTKLSQGLQDELKALAGKIQDLLGAKGKDIQGTAMQLAQTRSTAQRQALMDQLTSKLNVAQQKLAERSQSFSESVTNAASGTGTSSDSAGWDAIRKQPGYGPRSESAITNAINMARMTGQNNLTGAMAYLQQAIDSEKQAADKNGKNHNPLNISYLTNLLQIFYNNVGPTGATTTTTTSKKGTTTSVKSKVQ